VLLKMDTITGQSWKYQELNIAYPTRYGTNLNIVSDGWRELGPFEGSNDLVVKLNLQPTNSLPSR